MSVDKEAKLVGEMSGYRSLYDNEVKVFKKRFKHKSENLVSGDASSFVDELAEVFGDLSIRVKVLEAAVRSELFVNEEIKELLRQGKSPEVGSQYYSENLRLGAAELTSLEGFGHLETSEHGQSYCWTEDSVHVRVSLMLDRADPRILKIRLIGEVKPGLIETCRLLVDGKVCEHHLLYDGELSCLFAKLPQSDMQQPTKLVLQLEGVYSPKELSSGEDERKLGVAIESISTVDRMPKKQSFVRRAGRKLKQS